MSMGLVLSVGGPAALVTAGFVAVGVSELTGSHVAGAVASVVVLVAEVILMRTVQRLMDKDAAAALAARVPTRGARS
jgi:hypothetical protein